MFAAKNYLLVFYILIAKSAKQRESLIDTFKEKYGLVILQIKF